MILQGDCLKLLDELEEESVDAIVTDPPYELGFMGKSWDKSGISFRKETWEKCLRVLKPGGHLLAFGGTRTCHRIVCAIEDAGFEIRDTIAWIYGSGFPKSLDVSKAIDKADGAEREVISKEKNWGASKASDGKKAYGDYAGDWSVTKPVTDNAKKWEGWGTALKPALEPICLARKPLSEKTVAENVLRWGTGALNIGECKIGTDIITTQNQPGVDKFKTKYSGSLIPKTGNTTHEGRWPANLIHDGSEEVERIFPETMPSNSGIRKNRSGMGIHDNEKGTFGKGDVFGGFDDSGSASRFFYCAKASKEEREYYNMHPTVKPISLMEYLIKLVTRKDGIVLDPFAGSGSTLVAAKKLGRKYIGIEMNPKDVETAKKRLERTSYEPELPGIETDKKNIIEREPILFAT